MRRIAEEVVAAGGALGFDRYMELALFAPGRGYYVGGATKFGAAGDFVTAPELSPLFGAAIAQQCAEILERLGGGAILEFGAGTGRLAASVLAALAERDCLPARYRILELSPELRARQHALLSAEVPDLVGRVEWLRAPPTGFEGVILANEVLDSLPVNVFSLARGQLSECCVTWRDGALVWCTRAPGPALARDIEAALAAAGLPRDAVYRSEINRRLGAWMADLAGCLTHGVALIADYGYPRAEYYHPSRDAGTLQCYYRHRVHADPLRLPGIQDITASVDFTAAAEAAHDAGLEVMGYAEQASFLLACGMTDLLARAGHDPNAQARAAQGAKYLLLPSEMGSRVKFLAVGTAGLGPLLGFRLRNDLHRL